MWTQQVKLLPDIMLSRGLSLFLLIILVSLVHISTVHASDKTIIGWLENVKINQADFQLKAKIDTGATTSSLNARIIKTFKKNNNKWLRFRIENNEGQDIILEKKLLRTVKIKRKRALAIKRPVVLLGVCLGKTYRELEVNLANRENFEYQMLVGRNFLKDYFIVDSSLTYTATPSCN